MDNKEKHENIEQPLAVFFVRHGQAQSREEGGDDPSLTSLGRQQAGRISRFLGSVNFEHIYLSDLARAEETAEAIITRQDGTPFTKTHDLREVMFYNFLSGFNPTSQIERDIVSEERRVMNKFVKRLLSKHGAGEKILVVAHGNLIRCLVSLFSGKNPKRSVVLDISNTGLTILEVWLSGGAVLRVANSVKHLKKNQVT